EEHLHRLEEAKKRDHRKLGRELDLFSTDERVGQGLILWHAKGSLVRMEIENYERDLILRHGYQIVYTPHIMSEKIFEISGHLENFKEGMFGAMEVEGTRFRPKPMNCPGHIAVRWLTKSLSDGDGQGRRTADCQMHGTGALSPDTNPVSSR
ncbi:MAG: hypothetical protein R6W98_18200, partial [Oceanibaculum nanhaiense]